MKALSAALEAEYAERGAAGTNAMLDEVLEGQRYILESSGTESDLLYQTCFGFLAHQKRKEFHSDGHESREVYHHL